MTIIRITVIIIVRNTMKITDKTEGIYSLPTLWCICIIYPQELTKVPIYLVLSLGAQHHPESWIYIYTYIENNNNNYNNNNEKKSKEKDPNNMVKYPKMSHLKCCANSNWAKNIKTWNTIWGKFCSTFGWLQASA